MTLALTFLAPTAGLIAAAISVPLLALLYFLKLRRRPLRVSSTLLWEQATADLQVNAPFRWIRFSWLLVLQILILACACLALARPALDSARAATGRIVILIDHSASMSALDAAPDRTGQAPITRLERARRDAQEFIDRLGSDARAMVISYAARPSALTGLTRDRGQLRNAVRSIEPTDEPADLQAALRIAGTALLSESEGADAAPPARVLIFSDGNTDEPRLAGPRGVGSGAVEFLRAGPPAEAPRNNIGITALAARRDLDDPATVRVFARVESTLAEVITVALTARLADRVVSTTTIEIPARDPGDDSAFAAHTFEIQTVERAVLTLTLARPDDLDADNTAAIVLRPPGAARILLVQPNIPTGGVDLLLIAALEALAPRSLRSVTAAEYAQIERAGAFADHDLIVFDRVRPSALPPLPSVSFGATLPIPGLGVAPFDEGGAAQGTTGFIFWQRTHPVLRYVTLNNVIVGRPMRLTLPTPDAADRTRAEAIASGASGPLIATVERDGVRRLVIGFELADSQWWRDASFPVFMKNAVDHLALSGDEQAGRALTTAEPLTVRRAPAANPQSPPPITVTGPVSLTRQVTPADPELITLGTLPRVGLYRLTGVGGDDTAVAVNLADTGESSIRTRDTLTIAGDDVAAQTIGASAPLEVWHWFVLAALLLLVFEWVLYAWRMKV